MPTAAEKVLPGCCVPWAHRLTSLGLLSHQHKAGVTGPLKDKKTELYPVGAHGVFTWPAGQQVGCTCRFQ